MARLYLVGPVKQARGGMWFGLAGLVGERVRARHATRAVGELVIALDKLRGQGVVGMERLVECTGCDSTKNHVNRLNQALQALELPALASSREAGGIPWRCCLRWSGSWGRWMHGRRPDLGIVSGLDSSGRSVDSTGRREREELGASRA